MTKRRQLLQAGGWFIGMSGLTLSGLPLSGCAPGRSPFEDLRVAHSIDLKSAAFVAGAPIPTRHTCDGENISPDLQWGAVPDNTQTLILVVDDPDAPGRVFVHWLVYNLPPETRQLAENQPKQAALTSGGVQAKNDFGNYGYQGPCPPSDTHRYVFRLFALDIALNLSSSASKREVIKAMQGHVLASGELVGLYSR